MSITQPPSRTSRGAKASPNETSPGQYAPHLEDPDPPMPIMTPAESKAAARKVGELLQREKVMDHANDLLRRKKILPSR